VLAAAVALGAALGGAGEGAAAPFRVLHASDVHLDPEYREMVNAACARPPCCRGGSGAARHSGEPLCDTPSDVALSALKAAAKIGQVHLVAWTGDTAPHVTDPAGSSRRAVLREALRTFAEGIQRSFPGVPVVPTLGHADFRGSEAQPEAVFATAAETWASFLPPSALRSLRYGGFYSMPVEVADSPDLKVRAIALNTEAWSMASFGSFVDSAPAEEQLAWLDLVLDQARAAGEAVLILGHTPPGVWGGSWGEASEHYQRLVAAAGATVAGQFFGGQHSGSFRVLRDGNGKPSSVAYVTPALTTFRGQHPSFRVYDLSFGPQGAPGGEHLQVRDFRQFYMNTSDATQSGTPDVFLWREGFKPERLRTHLPDLAPASWDSLAAAMAQNKELARRVQDLESNGAEWMEGQKMLERYTCGVRNVGLKELIDCAGQNEEQFIRQYFGSSHTYVLTSMFPFEVIYSRFCRSLAEASGLLPSDCPEEAF